MGFFKSEEEKQAITRRHEAKMNVLRDVYRQASHSERLIAFASVYATGGRLDSAVWGFDSGNAQKALLEFMEFIGADS